MALTAAQLTTFKADILANTDPAVVQAVADGANNVIADWYNDPAVPPWYVWRTSLTRAEVYAASDWGEVVNVNTNDLLAFQVLLAEGVVDPSKPNVRSGFGQIFRLSGNGSAPVTRAALLEAAMRTANGIEKVLSTGTGTAVSPATMGYEGSVSPADVRDALNS